MQQYEALCEHAIAEDIREILRQEQEHQIDLATALGENLRICRDADRVARVTRVRASTVA